MILREIPTSCIFYYEYRIVCVCVYSTARYIDIWQIYVMCESLATCETNICCLERGRHHIFARCESITNKVWSIRANERCFRTVRTNKIMPEHKSNGWLELYRIRNQNDYELLMHTQCTQNFYNNKNNNQKV